MREIVGVARQVKGRPDETRDFVQLYVPIAQDLADDMFLVVRPKSGPAEALTASVRAAISRVDTEQLVSVRSVDDARRHRLGGDRPPSVPCRDGDRLCRAVARSGDGRTDSEFSAYSVQQQVRDFGVRRALGATTTDVLRMVVGNAARLVGTGAAIGLVLAILGGRLIETMLFGVRPLDLTTFAFVTVVLAIIAALSIIGPAWRAARIDPAVALRNT